MATKTASTATTASLKEVRAAWKRTHSAWRKVETSLTGLAEAEAALLKSLRKAGTAWTRVAGSEVRSTLKDLDRKRRSATREFEKLVQRHGMLQKTTNAGTTQPPA